MSRGLWFVAGAGAGIYAMLKARRTAEVFTPEGLRDRVAGLGLGAHLFAEEVRAGMTEKETELRERLGWALDGPGTVPGELGPASAESAERAERTGGVETLAGSRSSTNEMENL